MKLISYEALETYNNKKILKYRFKRRNDVLKVSLISSLEENILKRRYKVFIKLINFNLILLI